MLLHSQYPSDLTTRSARRAWIAGRNDAQIADLNAAGYVTKYVTKDLVDESTDRLPRIRASRSPRYGDAVMQHEEAIVQELQRRNDPTTVEVWGANLRMLHRYLMDQEKGTTRVWQEIHAAQQQVAKLDLGQGVLVDPTTGEKFQKTTRR